MRTGDVWGAILADVLDGKRAMEIVERDDGHMLAFDAGYFVAPFSQWDDPLEKRAMRFARGRVLDVGCGGGRVCLHLQQRGLEVVGIDSSPGAVEGCLRRGVRDARVLRLEDVDAALGQFDTFVFMGQNLGMLGSRTRARRLLRRLAALSTERGRIVGETFDPHSLDEPVHRRYRARNRRSGRMPGQLRVRIRYRDVSTPWLDWLQLSPAEFDELVVGTGWRVVQTLGDGPSYVAILERT